LHPTYVPYGEDWTQKFDCQLLGRVRDWLIRNVRVIGAAIMVLLAAVLLRNGISGLTRTS
jgi:hypothetical protein